MDAKLTDIQKLKSGGWLISVDIIQFEWLKLRFTTTQAQFFTEDYELNYATDWFDAKTGLDVDSTLERELCRVTNDWEINEDARNRLLNLDVQVISDGDKRKPIE